MNERKVEELERQNAKAVNMNNAKVQRIQHYRELEQGQKKRNLNVHVTVNNNPISSQHTNDTIQPIPCGQH